MPSKEMRTISLDLSRPSDRVCHVGVLYILEFNDVSGKQRVVLNEKSSNWKSMSVGVPQRSVLNPLFFS